MEGQKVKGTANRPIRVLAISQICRHFVKFNMEATKFNMGAGSHEMLVSIQRVISLSKLALTCQITGSRRLSLLCPLLSSRMYRPIVKGRKLKSQNLDDEPDGDNVTTEDEKVLDSLLDRAFLRRDSGQQIFVIQPYIKWGAQKKRNTTPQLQLLEAVTLIKTLRQWKVVDQAVVSLLRFRKKAVFGSGVLENLKTKVRTNSKISAVFISINTLTFMQQQNLEMTFGVPVFDRYTIIMHIFKEHAQTREAKLQIQMAQLPYLKTVLRSLNDGMSEKYIISGSFLGGEGPKLMSLRREVFKLRQAQIRREIESLRESRMMMRQQRGKSEIPVVAVIGYTNSGKTSLIKALTGKKSLEPQNYLFATLDVTSHLGELPSGMKAYFVDTLGFINDIPTYLIESFVSTLEDAVLANVIIHVRDISHPDTIAQNDNVIRTLKELNISEEALSNVITVGNKIDLMEREKLDGFRDLILVSSTKLTGIDVLRHEVQNRILQVCDKVHIIIRVETGSEEYNWLHSWSTVVKEVPDPKHNQFMLTEVIISSVNLAKFKYNFIKNHKR